MLNHIANIFTGRSKRSAADSHLENIIGSLSKLALEQEDDAAGGKRWHLAQRANEAEVDE